MKNSQLVHKKKTRQNPRLKTMTPVCPLSPVLVRVTTSLRRCLSHSKLSKRMKSLNKTLPSIYRIAPLTYRGSRQTAIRIFNRQHWRNCDDVICFYLKLRICCLLLWQLINNANLIRINQKGSVCKSSMPLIFNYLLNILSPKPALTRQISIQYLIFTYILEIYCRSSLII